MYTLEHYTIPEVVEKSSQRYAERPALAMVGGNPVRFRELEPRTRKIAAFLGLLGVKKGDRVALLSENRPEWGLAYFGIARSGAIAVPIMTDFLAEQISTILEHSESKVILVSGRLLPKIAAEGKRRIVVSLEDFSVLSAPQGLASVSALIRPDAVARAADFFVSPPIDADELASIVYTSGTMGKSKGVMLTHRNLVFDAEAARKFLVLRRTDRLLSILPLAHAYKFTIGFLIPVLQGSAVYYLDRPPSATALLPALAAIRPTLMLSVPLVIEKIYRSSIQPTLEKIPPLQGPAPPPGSSNGSPASSSRRPSAASSASSGRRRPARRRRRDLPAHIRVSPFDRLWPHRVGAAAHRKQAGQGPAPYDGRSRDRVSPSASPTASRHGRGRDPGQGPNVFPGYYKDPERSAEAFSPTLVPHRRPRRDGRLRPHHRPRQAQDDDPRRLRREHLSRGDRGRPQSSPDVLESLVYGDAKGLTALVHLKPEASRASSPGSRTRSRAPRSPRPTSRRRRTRRRTTRPRRLA